MPEDDDAATGRAQFAEQVADTMRRAGVRDVVVDAEQFAIQYQTSDGYLAQLHLDNLYDQWGTWDSGERDTNLNRYLSIALQAAPAPQTWDEVAESLRPAVRPTSWRYDNPAMISRPALPCLREYVVIDSPTRMSFVQDDHLEAWGVDEAEVFRTARANLEAHEWLVDTMDGPAARNIKDPSDDLYLASHLLLDGWLARIAQKYGGPPVVFIPDQQTMIITPDDDATVLQMLEVAEEAYRAAQRSLTPQAFTLDPASNAVAPYPVRPDRPTATAIHRAASLVANNEYYQQKRWLTEQLEADGEATEWGGGQDVAVASVLGITNPETGAFFTVSVVSEGCVVLLPRTDVVSFAGEDGSRLSVRFADAIAVLGWREEPDLDPPRYRVSDWPDPDQMRRLRSVEIEPGVDPVPTAAASAPRPATGPEASDPARASGVDRPADPDGLTGLDDVDVTRDQYAQLVIAALKRAGLTELWYVPERFQVGYRYRDGDATINLTPTYHEYRGSDRQVYAAAADRLVSALLETFETPQTWQEVAPLLRPTLRPAGYRQPGQLSRPALPYLREFVVVDTPLSRTYVADSRLAEWGVDAETVFATARANLAALGDPARGAQLTDPANPDQTRCVVFQDDGESYYTSWPLVDGWLADQVRDGVRPVVLFPDVNTLMIMRDDPAAVAEVVADIEERYREGRGISPTAYRADESGTLVPYPVIEGHPAAEALRRATALLAMDTYADQKAQLDDDHDQDGTDVFVASLLALQIEDGSLRTVAVWTEDVRTWLPQADLVAFQRQDDSEPFLVAWEDVTDLVSLTPLDDLDPPRYDVSAWPDAAVVAELQARALGR